MNAVAIFSCLCAATLLASCGGGDESQPAQRSLQDEGKAAGGSPASTARLARATTPPAARAAARADPTKTPPAVVAPAVSPAVPPGRAARAKEAARTARRILHANATPLSVPDGWAWQLDGHVVRTASLRNGMVAYYRGGADSPYLIQSNGRLYAYADRRLVRVFDQGGQPHPPNARQRAEASDLAGKARRQHRLAVAKLKTSG